MPAARRGGPDSIARNTAYSLAGQMVSATLTAVLTIFLVRALGPEGFGLFGLSTSISVIVLIAADFGISGSASRFAAERRDQADELGPLFVDSLKLKVYATGIVCVLLAALAGPIATAYGEPDLAWPLRGIALATFGQSLMHMSGGFFTALGKIVIRFRTTVAEAVLEFSASVTLVLLGGGATGAAFGRAFGYVIGALIGLTLAWRLVGRPALRPGRPPSGRVVRAVGRYAGALVVVDTAYVMSANANVLLIGGYLGSAAAGVFQAPFRLLAFLQYPGLSVANGVAPRLARRPGHEPDVGALETALRRLIVFQCIVLAPSLVWAEPILGVILGPGYEEAPEVLQVLAPYTLLSGVAPLVSISVNYLGEARRRIPISLATFVVTIGAGVTLIPAYGLTGAAIATDLALGFYTLAHLWLCHALVRLRLGRIARSLGVGLAAAAAMGLVLTAVGTSDLALWQWLAGSAGGLAAYLAVLVAGRELRPRDVARRIRRR